MEEWQPIHEFFGYSISNHGRVCNTRTGRIMSLSENQRSLVIVGMMLNGLHYKRTVSHLVAKAFLPAPQHETFDSVINLDGDRRNNWASNLAWRPRWFALIHQAQFNTRIPGSGIPIADMETGEEFINVWDAVIKYGLLIADVTQSIHHQTVVWPTNQRFWRLD